MSRSWLRAVTVAAGAVALAAFGAAGEQKQGQLAFDKRCAGCHALDGEKVGPRLAGVFGRKAGAVSGFPYSDALKNSSVVWDAPTLDKWLADPESVVRDTDMDFRLDDPAERAAIIAYLKQVAKK